MPGYFIGNMWINQDMLDKLSDSQVIAIQMAASGHISGTLEEWPNLRLAFVELGLQNFPTMNPCQMKILAKQALIKINQ